MRKAKVYIALLHYPMYNKRMDIITTSITNLDLHDISRAARTYDVDAFFLVHPSPSQHELIRDIISYWQEGFGGEYNPDRKDAFSIIRTATTLEELREYLESMNGDKVFTVATDARLYSNTISYSKLKNMVFNEEKSFLLLFGTGWGIQKEIMEACDYILQPIEADRRYNHLSVRSAVSIILDRLLGEYWFNL
ncbi:MAG: RNA methyltransferase [Syntrophomonas sp.]|uniref:RNA methyltransferase n=1 Tax=Syntrophomonas sp. TaxID=2053627 RepID=UPI00262581E8|nr:RNA methyltransferase [Syntrophomonas sp.]MDD2510976.1 RNA methyltransferase [Syntrophomonas sp.]MDD3879201.1 RNA methyltransferase [Syntrophomonas sp.]MDD4626472.1 RNA methyltransferase [Syntrophomonas sp.]